MLPSTINGKPVKNLGWLLRHWQNVRSFTITPHPRSERGGWVADAILTAHLKDGREYRTGFGCSTVLVTWLNRPVFRDVPQDWVGIAKP